VRAACRRREASFIKIENIALFLHRFVEALQEAFTVLFIELRLCVPRGFFYG
jgi:hypothetical protein